MSKRKVNNNLINTTINYNKLKPEIISPYYTTKMETIYQKDICLKKLYLPSIKKKTLTCFPSPATKLIKSHSQINVNFPFKETTKKPEEKKPNEERERILITKLNLSRIDSKINDIMFSCKKLISEKEANIKLIKEIINKNNFQNEEILKSKIKLMIQEYSKNNNYKKSFSTENFETIKYTIEEKNSKNEDIKNKNDKNNKNRVPKIKINISRINAFQEKNNKNKEENPEEEYNDFNEDKKEDNEENKQKEENKKNEKNNIIHIKGMIEENKNNENKENNIDSNNKRIEDINQEISNQDFSADNMLKINAISVNNSNFNNISFNNNPNNINNSIDEQMNLKEIVEEEKDGKNASIIFGKSEITNKFYNKLKLKFELSVLKYNIIKIQYKLGLKDEEIEEVKTKASMKNLLLQSNTLNTKMVKLRKIKTKNNKFEKLSIPKKNIRSGNLKNELDYYTKKNRSFISENKSVEESYIKVRNEYEENNKSFSRLAIQSDHLKYKYNSLKLKHVKKQIDLDNIKRKINQIDMMKLMIENNIKIRDEKKKEIEETKKILEEKNKECERIRVKREKVYQAMNKLNKEINNKINKQNNDYNKIQKDIKEIEKNILQEIDKFQHLTKNNKKFINLNSIYKTKTIPKFLDYLKELEKEIKKINKAKITRFENLHIGEELVFYKYKIVDKMEKKEEKKEEIKLEETQEKILEYYINSKGQLVLKNDDNVEKKEFKKREGKK